MACLYSKVRACGPGACYLCWKECRELHTSCLWMRTLCSLKYRACCSHCCRLRPSCSRCRASCPASTLERLGTRAERVGRAMLLSWFIIKHEITGCNLVILSLTIALTALFVCLKPGQLNTRHTLFMSLRPMPLVHSNIQVCY